MGGMPFTLPLLCTYPQEDGGFPMHARGIWPSCQREYPMSPDESQQVELEPQQIEYDLIVIGSGPVGQKAALAAAKRRARVALVERRQVVGGD